MIMDHKFFEFLEHGDREDKLHGKPLIRQNVFFSPKVMIIIEFVLSILFIALVNLLAIGLLVLLNTPMREFILGN